MREDATIKMWNEAEKLKGDNHTVLPLLLIEPNIDDDKLWNDLHYDNVLEFRQDENGPGSVNANDRHELMDIIEREREENSPADSAFAKIEEAHDVQTRPLKLNTYDDAEQTVQENLDKGEAYDRYVFLASQQEEEEERNRFIALAKQSREEEMLSYRQGDTDDDRYVCLA